MTVREALRLAKLKRQLGSDFEATVGREVAAEYALHEQEIHEVVAIAHSFNRAMKRVLQETESTMRGLTGQALDLARLMSEAVAKVAHFRVPFPPGLLLKSFSEARQGIPRALSMIVEYSPVEAMQDPDMSGHIARRIGSDKADDRVFLEGLAKAFRRGLLRPNRGGRPRIADAGAIALARALQDIFSKHRVLFTAKLRNPVVQRERLLSSLLPAISVLTRGQRTLAVQEAVEILRAQPRIRGEFGIQVAAKVYGCSARLLRSRMRAAKPGKN